MTHILLTEDVLISDCDQKQAHKHYFYSKEGNELMKHLKLTNKITVLFLTMVMLLSLSVGVVAKEFDVTSYTNPFTNKPYSEDDFYGNGTIIIILSHSASISWREYTAKDFPELDIESVYTHKPISSNQEFIENNPQYRNLIDITLKDKSNKAVIEAVEILHGKIGIYKAFPIWKTYYDVHEPVDDSLPEPAYIKGSGNVNGDGKIDLQDVSAMLKNIAGWNMEDLFFSTYYGDIDNDGIITMSDVTLLLQRIAGWNKNWYMNAITNIINQ